MKRVALALLLAGCPTADTDAPLVEGEAPDVDTTELAVHSADWNLAWTDDAADAGGRWTTTTDLGYTVTVEAGWVVDYSVTLAPCDTSVVASRTDRVLSLLGIGTAHANDLSLIHI